MSLLMRGLHGEPVRVLQGALGITADGIFGLATEEALKQYQQQNGLVVDGIAGPDTFSQMGLHELLLLARGTHGETVKKLQRGLSQQDDGKFGPGTEAAVRQFQEGKGLEVDGIAGPKTLALVDGFGEITQEKVDASLVNDSTPIVDPGAVAAVAASEPKPEGVVAKVEDVVAEVGKSIWNTVKKIF